KWLAVRNPTARAISPIERSPFASNDLACAIRRSRTNRCGGVPVLCRKSRAKGDGLIWTTAQSSARRNVPCRVSWMYAVTRRSRDPGSAALAPSARIAGDPIAILPLEYLSRRLGTPRARLGLPGRAVYPTLVG